MRDRLVDEVVCAVASVVTSGIDAGSAAIEPTASTLVPGKQLFWPSSFVSQKHPT